MDGFRWGIFLTFLISLLSAHAQLPLNHERYRILQTDASYTCDIRAVHARPFPLEHLCSWNGREPPTRPPLSTGVPLWSIHTASSLTIPMCIWLRARMIPSLKLDSGPTSGVGAPFYLQPTIIDVDFDQDGVEGKKGYTFFYEDNTFYVAYRTDDPMAYLYVFVVQVEAQGGPIGFVAREAPSLPQPAVELFPIPTLDRLNVRLTLLRPGTVTLTLYDLLGRLVWKETRRLTQGWQQMRLYLSALVTGIYQFELRQQTHVVRHPLVIRRY